MFDLKLTQRTLPQAYHMALKTLQAYGDMIPCPDWDCNQIELSMTMEIMHPLEEPMISRLIPCGPMELEQYRQEMLDGILDFEIERGNWPYTYHQRMGDQIDFVLRELRRNPFSRRAVIDIRMPEDMDSGDPACLQNIQYFIRDGALHCKALFRSNDAVKAAFMNAFALICLQKRIADQLGVKMGSYTHRANSFHCYERDFKLLGSYVNRAFNARSDSEITYRYDGEWEALMEEAQPEIAAKVEKLRGERR